MSGRANASCDRAAIFDNWIQGDLESFLMGITGIVLTKSDDATHAAPGDVMFEEAAQKRTGRWTAQEALGSASRSPRNRAGVRSSRHAATSVRTGVRTAGRSRSGVVAVGVGASSLACTAHGSRRFRRRSGGTGGDGRRLHDPVPAVGEAVENGLIGGREPRQGLRPEERMTHAEGQVKPLVGRERPDR